MNESSDMIPLFYLLVFPFLITTRSQNYSMSTVPTNLTNGCIIPNHPSNGKLSVVTSEESCPGDTVPEESAMFVGCDDGFSPSESYLATCLDKKWTTTLSCVAMCRSFQSLTVEALCTFGTSRQFKCDALQPSGTLATFRCKPGYHSPSKLPSSVCRNGKWNTKVPSCLPITTNNYIEESCILPPQIRNGWWIVGKNRGQPGTKVSNIAVLLYSCFLDYSLTGDKFVFCINGSWTSEPSCYRHCDPIASLSVQLTCRRRPGDPSTPCSEPQHSGTVVTLECKTWYNSEKPLVQMKCFDGKWDHPLPQCEPIFQNNKLTPHILSAEDYCRMPPNPHNGRYIAGANRDISAGFLLPGYAVLFVECDPGYAPTGFISYCSFIIQGQWSRLAECLKMCPPPIVPHSSILCEGYIISYRHNIREKPSCSEPLHNGTIIRIDCKSSYYSDSLIHPIVCRNGEWDSPMPVCKPKNLGNYIPVLTNGSCVLPDHDPNGNFVYPNNVELTTGDVVPKSSFITFTCSPGYYLEGNNVSICLQHRWNNIPKCLETCDVLESVTVDFSCSLNGVIINCSEPLRNGTIVISRCKSSYRTSQFVLPFITCIEGNWDRDPPRCTAECGTVTPESEEKIISGRSTKLGEFPWHTALYDQRKFTNTEQICGGSIVNALVVITAAHCVWDSYNRRAYLSSDYAVAAGKLYRDWNSPKDDVTLVQKSNISQIYVPSTYGGEAQNQQSDIAILVVETPFQFTSFIQPVCVHWDPQFDKFQLTKGNLGEVSGWGLTDVANLSSSSPTLKTIQLPYVDYSTCKELTPRTFQSLLVFDKFCAGYYKNGSAVCRGDSGGGLVFRSYELFTERYFLRGIVSVGPKNDLQTESCRDDTFTAFTHLLAHEQWVKDILEENIPY